MKFGTLFTSDKKRNGYGQIHFEFSLETFILGCSEPKKVVYRQFLYVRRPLEFKRLNIFWPSSHQPCILVENISHVIFSGEAMLKLDWQSAPILAKNPHITFIYYKNGLNDPKLVSNRYYSYSTVKLLYCRRSWVQILRIKLNIVYFF